MRDPRMQIIGFVFLAVVVLVILYLLQQWQLYNTPLNEL